MCAWAWFGAGSAAATTICVPTFRLDCPNAGGNKAEADVEKAMSIDAADGNADEIRIAAGAFTETAAFEPAGGDGETFEPTGSDPLTIAGAGPAATVLTGITSTNSYVINLNYNNSREITMRDLTIRAPASLPDGEGAAVQADRDHFLNVDVESRSPGADGFTMIGGSTFRDGRLFGAQGGSIGDAFRTNGAESGEMLIERTSIENASWGILVDDIGVVTRVRRTRIIDPVAYGLRVTTGGFAVMENSLIVVDDALAVTGETGSTETLILTLRHTTIVDTGGADNAAIDVGDGLTPKSGTVNAVISDTIIAGNENPLKCDSPMTNTTLTMRYSYFFHSALATGNCSLPVIQTIDAFLPDVGPPQFLGAGDYHLTADSPAIDSGDPLLVTLPTEDFDGAPRPVDGDDDGNARRDMGAFEYQPPGPPLDPANPSDPAGSAAPSELPSPSGNGWITDVEPPQTTIGRGPGAKLARGSAKFGFRSSEVGSSFVCKLDRRKAARCKPPKRYKGLAPGRHVFRVWAIDPTGNKDPTPARRHFRISLPTG